MGNPAWFSSIVDYDALILTVPLAPNAQGSAAGRSGHQSLIGPLNCRAPLVPRPLATLG